MKRLYMSSKVTDVPSDELVIALRFVLNSTFFTFNGGIYRQSFGTPMNL